MDLANPSGVLDILKWAACLQVDNQVLQARLRAENATLQTRLAQPCSLIPLPEWFDSNGQRFRGFINQCCLLFMMHPQTYTTDCAKVSLVINLLSGKALDWVSPFLECDSLVLSSWEDPEGWEEDPRAQDPAQAQKST
uniref:DUF4939 domain-containing protein n=1 Tax=Chrysemys picta bellii TaxID=8478 RepID=A0A8C3HQX7_CHRPI